VRGVRSVYVPGLYFSGAAGALLRARLQPSRARPVAFRLFASAISSVYAGTVLATVVIVHGTWWPATLLVGTVVLAAILGWLLSYVALPYEGRAPAGPVRGAPTLVAVNDVKVALESLHDGAALTASPLARLPCLTGPAENAAAELRALLGDVITEIAASRDPRDAESGRILLDYYVRRIGSHEVVMEPLHMSKQTYFRRLDKGKALVAERLDELSELALALA